MIVGKRSVCIKTYRLINNFIKCNEVFSYSRSATIASLHNISAERTIPINVSPASPPVDENYDSSSSFSSPGIKHGPNTTSSDDEVKKFGAMSDEWWKHNGDFAPLHSLNKLRVPLICDGLIDVGLATPPHSLGPRPLQNLRLLDVGCGGGILSEALARLGASVTGLDASAEGIKVAQLHAERDNRIRGRINYVCGSLEDHEQQYDAVIASEVLEHVSSVPAFLSACVAVLRPGGSLFLTTMNRTVVSFLGGIVMCEWVLGLMPKGTHEWGKFVLPQEILDPLAAHGLRTHLLHGMVYCPPTNSWHWSRDTAINYALHAVKPPITIDTNT